MRSSSVSLIREMLLTTESITVIPRDMLAGDIVRGAVAAVDVAFAAASRPAGLIRAPGRTLSPSAEAFVACLRERAGMR